MPDGGRVSALSVARTPRPSVSIARGITSSMVDTKGTASEMQSAWRKTKGLAKAPALEAINLDPSTPGLTQCT